MATLAVQAIVTAGLGPAYVSAATGGDEFLNDGRTFLHVKNAGSQITVTVTPKLTQYAVPALGKLAKSAVSVIVPATTGDRMIGPFPQGAFNDVNGKVSLTYSAATSVTVAAIRLPAED